MLQAVNVEVDPSGHVKFMEPLVLQQRYRAVLTILEPVKDQEGSDTSPPHGSNSALLKFLAENRLPLESRLSTETIDEQIREAREGWD